MYLILRWNIILLSLISDRNFMNGKNELLLISYEKNVDMEVFNIQGQ